MFEQGEYYRAEDGQSDGGQKDCYDQYAHRQRCQNELTKNRQSIVERFRHFYRMSRSYRGDRAAAATLAVHACDAAAVWQPTAAAIADTRFGLR
jgi:hypothetical protein